MKSVLKKRYGLIGTWNNQDLEGLKIVRAKIVTEDFKVDRNHLKEEWDHFEVDDDYCKWTVTTAK